MDKSTAWKHELDPTAYSNWQSLSGLGLPHCYRAVRLTDSRPVQILFFPAVDSGALPFDQFQQQLNLFTSVMPTWANIELAALEGPSLCIVRSTAEEIDLESFIEQVDLQSLLRLIADFLQRINQNTRSRLYHGKINESSLTVQLGPRPALILNYLHRYCLPANEQEKLSNPELCQRDLQDTLDLCARLIEPRLIQAPEDSTDAMAQSLARAAIPATASQDDHWSLEPRQLAVLRALCRRRSAAADAEELNESFERWLDLFEEFATLSAALDDQPRSASNPQLDGTQDIDSFLHLQSKNQETSALVFDSQNTAAMEGQSHQSLSAVSRALEKGAQFGRYMIEQRIGQGGMGAVYLGTDTATGQTVAIKVLRAEGATSAQAIRRFHKEARLLASLQNEHVTQLIEVGLVDSMPFIAMEFVHGIDLKQWLRGRMPLEERQALGIVRDIASALVEAHQRGIIHRDIKPENVMLAAPAEFAKEEMHARLELDQCTLKLMDFGIAREIHQSQSMEVTQAGGILGTPLYMSPEQVSGSDEISTTTDVYALGITLYELLCGAVPFDDVDFIKIAAKHCFDAVPDIRRRNAKVSEPICLLIHRMLDKKADQRPANASQLIREIDAILEDSPNDFALHPIVPDFGAAHIWSRDFEWVLKSGPDELWPHVSNTERVNRAMGVASVDYRTEIDPNRGVRRFGSFKIGGVKVEWEEHPFEWVEGTRFGVLREFQTGPFKWFLSQVELKPVSTGGTRLVHSVRIEPRSTLGRMISEFEVGWKGGRSLDRIYRRIDESIASEKEGKTVWDRFEKVKKFDHNQLERLELRVDRMAQLGANLEITHKLSEYVQHAPPQEIVKIRPARLAQQLNIPTDDLLDCCLIATAAGLLSIQWDIICPTCRVAADNEPILTSIKKHTYCEACDTEFQTSIAQAIELTFRVHPEIRSSNTGRYCIGGPWHAPHVVTQVRLMPAERLTMSLAIEPGDYVLRAVGSLQRLPIAARTSNALVEMRCDIGSAEFDRSRPFDISSGLVKFTLVNHADVPKTVRIERTVERDSVITAARVCSTPRFRDLFPEQRLREDLPISSEELSLLVVQLHDLDSLYTSLGDQAAYELILEFLQTAQAHVTQAGGTVARHSDGGLIAVFVDCEQAVQAGLTTLRDPQLSNERFKTRFGIGLHRGRTLIAQRDGLNDYFGMTLRTALTLAACESNALAMTDAVATDPAVRSLLDSTLRIETRAIRVADSALMTHIVSTHRHDR